MAVSDDPVVIPIRSTDDASKEWAMMEVNGELLPPKDRDAIAQQPYIELGSLTYGADGKVRACSRDEETEASKDSRASTDLTHFRIHDTTSAVKRAP